MNHDPLIDHAMPRCIFIFLAFLTTSGCVSRVDISRIESIGGDYLSLRSTQELLNKGLSVGNGYLATADNVAVGMDTAAIATIVLAAGAATAVVNGASEQAILKAGIAGVAGSQVVGYFNPSDARDALTRAANRQYCIVAAGSPFSTGNSPEINAILAQGFNNVRMNLRSDLNRDSQSYSALLAQYRTSMEANNSSNVVKIRGARSSRDLEVDIEQFRRKVLECSALT